MEIPRYWREMPTNTSFTGREKKSEKSGLSYFKYPTGQILLEGSLEQVWERFSKKGFTDEVTAEILDFLGFGVAAEAPIPLGEVIQGFHEAVGSKVGK